MDILIYFSIFIFKVLENALGTLRMILVSGGRKQIGAILQLIISIIWIISTSMVITNIINNPFKIIAFSTGTYVGSLVGSIIEEKLALGSILIIAITHINSKDLIRCLRRKGFAVTSFNGQGKKDYRSILMIHVKRKLRKEVFSIIKKYDEKAMLIVENANATGGYH